MVLMTYFGVLSTFVLIPLLLLTVVVPHDVWHWLFRHDRKVNWKPYLAILVHVALALIYTTPWDNYLVATGVWWYDPALVTGWRLGWVPLEEYTFFVLQTLLTGLWAVALIRIGYRNPPQVKSGPGLRRLSVLILLTLWVISTVVWLSGWEPGTYLALILCWAVLPLSIQLAFGADILLANFRIACLIVLPPTFYLWWVDALAITSGTWSIDPAQTTGILLGGLPLEEMIFFFVTNLIIGLGMILFLSPLSYRRLLEWRTRFSRELAVHGSLRF